MTWITIFAAFAFLVSSYPALAEEGNGTGPVRLECASRGDAASSQQAEANPTTARGRKCGRGPGCAATAVANRPASSHGREAATKRRRATGTPARRVSGN